MVVLFIITVEYASFPPMVDPVIIDDPVISEP